MIQQSINESVSLDNQSTLTFSNGWIQKFKKRNRFKMYRSHGVDGDADESAIQSELPNLKARLLQYAINDTWNADEFGLFYALAPTTTIGPGQLPGRKKQKDRIKFLACANEDGTEKFPLFVICKSAQPRCFGGKTSSELGIDYCSSANLGLLLPCFMTGFFDSMSTYA